MAGGSLHVTLRGPDGQERDLTFNGDVLRVGRARDCDLPLDSGYVSRYHARIERADDGWTVADEGSKNGIYVNGQRVNGTWSLEAGDTVRVGDYSLVVDPQKIDYERTLAIPFVDRSARGRSSQGATPEREVAEPAVSGVPAAAAAPEQEPEPAAPPPPPARVVVDAAAGQVTVDGHDVTGTIGDRGLRLVKALYLAPDGRDADELVGAVWGTGRADVEMLERLVDRLQRQLEPGTAQSTLVHEREEGGYRLLTV